MKDKNIIFKVTENQYKALNILSKLTKESKSEIIRKAIVYYIIKCTSNDVQEKILKEVENM